MIWNGKPYYDHPPMGFWLMSLSYKIFGVNEFSTRFPSAFLGLLTILLIYKAAIELFKKKTIGFGAALILGTCVWYTIRVRSGNLDSTFVFFYILTVYLSLRSSKNFKWFPLTMMVFGGLILSKTLVGLSSAVLIVFLNWRQLLNLKKNYFYMLIGVLAFILMVYPWYYIQKKTYSDFVQQHFINIGTRNKTLSSYFRPVFEQPLFYLHMGVRKWYYIWLLSLGFLLVTLKFLKKNIFFLILWNFIILYPFLTSRETELWHLIPVYLPLSFIIAAGIYELVHLVINVFLVILRRVSDEGSRSDAQSDRKLRFGDVRRPFSRFFTSFRMTIEKKRQIVIEAVYISIFLYISFIQIKIFYQEVFPANKWIPDDVAISKAAARYEKPIFLDDDYIPIAVFYSGKNIQPLAYLSDDKKTLAKFMLSNENDFVVITRNWVVDDLASKNIKYKLLEKNNSFSILTKP